MASSFEIGKFSGDLTKRTAGREKIKTSTTRTDTAESSGRQRQKVVDAMRCGISFHVLSKLELLLSVLSGNAYLSPPIALTAPSQIFCGIIFQPGIEISSIATDQVSCNCLEFRKKAEGLVISIPTCGVACLPQGYFLGVRTTPSNATNTQLSPCPRPPTISYGSFEYVQAARRGYILS